MLCSLNQRFSSGFGDSHARGLQLLLDRRRVGQEAGAELTARLRLHCLHAIGDESQSQRAQTLSTSKARLSHAREVSCSGSIHDHVNMPG